MNDKKQITVFKALSDPVRLEIIKYLKNVNTEVSCGEVGKAVHISKTSGSYHFKLLEAAGLIKTRKESREKFVCLNQTVLNEYVTNFYKNI